MSVVQGLVEVPALGRYFELGSFYDLRTQQILPGKYRFHNHFDIVVTYYR